MSSKAKRSSSSQSSSTTSVKATGSYIVSIDVGRNNLAVFVYEWQRRVGVFWHNFDMRLRRYEPNTYRKHVKVMLESIPFIGDMYLVERQVPRATKNCIIEVIIHCIVAEHFHKKSLTVSPSAVRKFFSLRNDTKHFKKMDAAFVCDQIIDCQRARVRMLEESMKSTFRSSKKRDDLADCFLQALYYAETTLAPRPQFDPKSYNHYEGRTIKAQRRRREISEQRAEKQSAAKRKRQAKTQKKLPVAETIDLTSSSSSSSSSSLTTSDQEESDDDDDFFFDDSEEDSGGQRKAKIAKSTLSSSRKKVSKATYSSTKKVTTTVRDEEREEDQLMSLSLSDDDEDDDDDSFLYKSVFCRK